MHDYKISTRKFVELALLGHGGATCTARQDSKPGSMAV